MFGAEYVTMKVVFSTLHAIQYQLRIMGISMSEASYVYGDNILVFHNTSKPESTLKKRCNAIAYYAICNSTAMGERLTGHVRSENNSAPRWSLDIKLNIVCHYYLITSMMGIPNSG